MHIPNYCIYFLLLAGTAIAHAETTDSVTPATGAKHSPEEELLLTPVIVTGVQASLISAQEIKREKLEIVDAIVAEDVHKLPDASVGEALQRVTGVQIARDRGESGQVAIRGLNQIETTLNGREIFTAGTGRSLDFADIPAELVSSINVYKTSSAEHIEGGLGGLIDLQTRRPFDFTTPQLVLSARRIHGSLVDQGKTQFSTLLSNRWQTPEAGEFGALLSLAYQERAWREDQKSTGNPIVRTDLLAGRSIRVPNGTSETTSVGDRTRTGASLFLQWRPTDHLELYAEGNYAEFRTRQNSYQINVLPSSTYAPGSLSLYPGTDNLRGITWTNARASILSFARDTVDRTKTAAIGGIWTHQALTLKADLSHTTSHNDLYFGGLVLSGTAATFAHDLASRTPDTAVGGSDLSDPASLQIASVAYRRRPFDGALTALKLDGDYLLGGFVDTLSAGLRLARRRADNGSGLIFGDAAVSGLSAADRPGYFMSNPYGNFFPGSASIGNYLVGQLSTARDINALRAAMGLTGALPTAGNPLGLWNIEENTAAAYLMATLNGGRLPLDGNIGLRLVHTTTAVAGNQSLTGGGTAPIQTETADTDALPSLNLRYEPSAGLYLRAAASKTITRPDFNQLSPSLTLIPNTINPSQNQGNAGNPALRPIRANNFDLAVEKYFSRHTAIHLTGFFKQVDGFIGTLSSPETHGGQVYQVSRPQNSTPADIRGFEVGYQQFYDFLPGWLRGLGLQANYTYVDSETPDRTLGRNVMLQNLSKHSANLVGIYEKGRISARLAYNWRDKYLSGIANIVGVGALPIYTRAYGWLDASLSYRIDDRISLTLEGLNLTQTVRTAYYGDAMHPQSSWRNDRQLALVATLRY